MWRAFLLGMSFLVGAAPAALRPPTAKDRFQAHGLGRLTCKRVRSRSARPRRRSASSMVPTWFEGYLTGFNALYQDTFDILPWQPPGLLAEFTLQGLQAKNPDKPMLEVVNDLIRDLLIPQPDQGRGEDRVQHRRRQGCDGTLSREHHATCSSAWSSSASSRAAPTVPSGRARALRSKRSRRRRVCRAPAIRTCAR